MNPPPSRSGSSPGESHGAPGTQNAGIPTDLAHASRESTVAGPDLGSTHLHEEGSTLLEPPTELQQHPRYRLLERIGAGGMGVVFKARHRIMDRVVAIKVVRGSVLDRPDVAARFEREVRAAALSHANIVTAYDAEPCGPHHFLVMEYVQGTNLADLIAHSGPLPVAVACDYARQAALGLEHAFRLGMVHRDVKPHNLILASPSGPEGSRGLVKILDFGLARLLQEARPAEMTDLLPAQEGQADRRAAELETLPGTLMGTAAYMAPEQARNPSSADIRADIYSLGCTLYHFLTGRPPFLGGVKERLEAHRAAVPQPPSFFRCDIPAALERVLERMMAKDPAERYQTPAEVAEALAPFTVPQQAPPSRPRRRLAVRAIGLVLAALLLGAAVARVYYSFHAPSPVEVPAEDPLVVTVPVRHLEGHNGPIHSMACSSDGTVLVSAGRDRTVRVWDLVRGEQRQLFRGHTDRVRCLALSRDGSQALSASDDGTVRVWDLAAGRERLCFREHQKSVRERQKSVTSVAFSPDERHVLSGSENNLIVLWELATGKVVRRFSAPAECLAFSPDGAYFLSGWWDDNAYLWHLERGKVVRTLGGHEGGIKSVSFSPDGKLLLLASEDRALSLWDFESGQRLRHWKAHKGLIWSAAFSGDGRRLLSAGWDRTARLWDVATGRELQRFAPDAEELLCVLFTPNGRQAICGSADGGIRLWNLPP